VSEQNEQQENLSGELSLWRSSLPIQERRDHEGMPMQLLHLYGINTPPAFRTYPAQNSVKRQRILEATAHRRETTPLRR
jgi:hypothetical protein